VRLTLLFVAAQELERIQRILCCRVLLTPILSRSPKARGLQKLVPESSP